MKNLKLINDGLKVSGVSHKPGYLNYKVDFDLDEGKICIWFGTKEQYFSQNKIPPTRIYITGELVWSLVDEIKYFDGWFVQSRFTIHNNFGPTVVICGKNQNIYSKVWSILRVIPLNIFFGESFSVQDSMQLKKDLSFFGEVYYDDQEKLFLKTEQEKLIEKRLEAERLKKEEENNKRQKLVQKSATRSSILNRPKIYFFNGNEKMSAIPVLETEWRGLPGGKFIVVVTYYNGVNDYGDIVECFETNKVHPTKPKKVGVISHLSKKPVCKKNTG